MRAALESGRKADLGACLDVVVDERHTRDGKQRLGVVERERAKQRPVLWASHDDDGLGLLDVHKAVDSASGAQAGCHEGRASTESDSSAWTEDAVPLQR